MPLLVLGTIVSQLLRMCKLSHHDKSIRRALCFIWGLYENLWPVRCYERKHEKTGNWSMFGAWNKTLFGQKILRRPLLIFLVLNLFFIFIFLSFFFHSLQCTLNLLTQVNNNLYKYLRLAEIPVGKTGVPGVKTTAKGICRAP